MNRCNRNIGEKELCSMMRSLIEFGKKHCNCISDVVEEEPPIGVASSHEIEPDSGYESDVQDPSSPLSDNLEKISERLETISSDITSNQSTVVRLDDDLRGLASNVRESVENIEKLEKQLSDIEKRIDETSRTLLTKIMLIKAENETRMMDMKSFLDMVVNRVDNIESSTKEAFDKLNNVEVSCNENIATQKAYIDDSVMEFMTSMNKLEQKWTVLNAAEINNLKKLVQSYKDENSELSGRINNLVAANINRNLMSRHE